MLLYRIEQKLSQLLELKETLVVEMPMQGYGKPYWIY